MGPVRQRAASLCARVSLPFLAPQLPQPEVVRRWVRGAVAVACGALAYVSTLFCGFGTKS